MLYCASMNGSQNCRRMICRFMMKESDDTVNMSTCIPERLRLRLMARAKYCSTASRASADARTKVLKTWKRELWV